MRDEYSSLPVVYSCSGCSSAAQMANDLAVSLDRDGVAEMSCIAGVGGNVQPLVQTATSDRSIVAIDGCPLECARNCLAKHDVTPDRHYELTEFGVRKEFHAPYDEAQFSEIREQVLSELDPVTDMDSLTDDAPNRD